MDVKSSTEILVQTLQDLKVLNVTIPILVEGRKDVDALRKIGFNGNIVTIHRGKNLPCLCDELSKNYSKIILLTDWDKRGWKLTKRIEECLLGRITCLANYRLILAEHAQFKDIESTATFLSHNDITLI